jgi:hypothetical protein
VKYNLLLRSMIVLLLLLLRTLTKLVEYQEKKSILVFLGDVKQTVNTPIVIEKTANIVNAYTPVRD